MRSAFMSPGSAITRRVRGTSSIATTRIRAAVDVKPVRQESSAQTEALEFVLDSPGLLQGTVIGRPNRFIFRALIPSASGDLEVEAHSPAVGKITGIGGILSFAPSSPVRALFSQATGRSASTRRTRYTVEALDLGAGSPTDTPKYCGINQTKSNEYLDFFLRAGMLPEILPAGCKSSRREVTAPDGKSRIDIVATMKDGKEVWIENKTMLNRLPIDTRNPAFNELETAPKMPMPTEKDRLLKHWSSLRELAKGPNTEAVSVITYLMNVNMFESEQQSSGRLNTKAYKKIMQSVSDAVDAGVRFVQVNFVFGEPEENGRTVIRLGDVYELNF